jgi:hypothetical protein
MPAVIPVAMTHLFTALLALKVTTNKPRKPALTHAKSLRAPSYRRVIVGKGAVTE